MQQLLCVQHKRHETPLQQLAVLARLEVLCSASLMIQPQLALSPDILDNDND